MAPVYPMAGIDAIQAIRTYLRDAPAEVRLFAERKEPARIRVECVPPESEELPHGASTRMVTILQTMASTSTGILYTVPVAMPQTEIGTHVSNQHIEELNLTAQISREPFRWSLRSAAKIST